MRFVANLLISTLSVLVAAYIVPNVFVQDLKVAFIVAIVLGILNTFVRPVVHLLTLPITLLTLGLFSLVVNTLMVVASDALIDGFDINGFLWAFLFSVVVSLSNSFFNHMAKS